MNQYYFEFNFIEVTFSVFLNKYYCFAIKIACGKNAVQIKNICFIYISEFYSMPSFQGTLTDAGLFGMNKATVSA